MKIRTVHLDAVCERIDYGFTASADFSIPEPRLLRITDIQDGAVDWNHVPGCRIAPEDEVDKRLCAGDIVFARTGATTGKCFLIKHTPRAVFASYLIRLRATNEVLPHYLYAFFQSENYWHQIRGAVRGAAQGGVNSTTLSSLVLPLPDLTEQRRIAGQVEQADRLRRTRRYALELTDTFLPAAFIEMFGLLHENERKWTLGQLEENAEIASGVAKGQKYGNSKTLEVPYLRVANVQDGYLDLSEIKTIRVPPQDVEALRLQPGDVVMTEGGDFDKLGRGAIWPGGFTDCIHQNHIFRVRLNQSALTPIFFAAFLRSGFAKDYFLRCSKQTTNLASINMTQLRATPVPLPPLPVQREFVALVERVERLRAVQREALRQAEHLFASLLDRAFSV